MTNDAQNLPLVFFSFFHKTSYDFLQFHIKKEFVFLFILFLISRSMLMVLLFSSVKTDLSTSKLKLS